MRAFQHAKGLTADGIVGPKTWPALIMTVRSGDSGEAVKGVQQEANDRQLAGHAIGLTIDGEFGPMTEEFVRRFQRLQHLFPDDIAVDGIVGDHVAGARRRRPALRPSGRAFASPTVRDWAGGTDRQPTSAIGGRVSHGSCGLWPDRCLSVQVRRRTVGPRQGGHQRRTPMPLMSPGGEARPANSPSTRSTARGRVAVGAPRRAARRRATSALAAQVIHDELMLDGNARLNLATFVTASMEPEARASWTPASTRT